MSTYKTGVFKEIKNENITKYVFYENGVLNGPEVQVSDYYGEIEIRFGLIRNDVSTELYFYINHKGGIHFQVEKTDDFMSINYTADLISMYDRKSKKSYYIEYKSDSKFKGFLGSLATELDMKPKEILLVVPGPLIGTLYTLDEQKQFNSLEYDAHFIDLCYEKHSNMIPEDLLKSKGNEIKSHLFHNYCNNGSPFAKLTTEKIKMIHPDTFEFIFISIHIKDPQLLFEFPPNEITYERLLIVAKQMKSVEEIKKIIPEKYLDRFPVVTRIRELTA